MEGVDYYYEFTSDEYILRLTNPCKDVKMEYLNLCSKRGLILDFIYIKLKGHKFAGAQIWWYNGGMKFIDCMCF